MTKQSADEHSSIAENNAPLGWGLKLVILGFSLLCLAYGILYFHTDTVSQDAPGAPVRHGRGGGE
ncbi:MAG: hypothetical protein ABIK89_22660 [Planctomycetota bacterium]